MPYARVHRLSPIEEEFQISGPGQYPLDGKATDSALVALIETFDIATFDSTDTIKFGLNHNMVDRNFPEREIPEIHHNKLDQTENDYDNQILISMDVRKIMQRCIQSFEQGRPETCLAVKHSL